MLPGAAERGRGACQQRQRDADLAERDAAAGQPPLQRVPGGPAQAVPAAWGTPAIEKEGSRQYVR